MDWGCRSVAVDVETLIWGASQCKMGRSPASQTHRSAYRIHKPQRVRHFRRYVSCPAFRT